MLADGGAENPHVALAWANMLPDGFLQLLEGRESLALVIVAYYCVVLDRFSQLWWVRGWSKGLLGAIYQDIQPVYRNALEWPRTMIGMEI
jgi:hypothetical protein